MADIEVRSVPGIHAICGAKIRRPGRSTVSIVVQPTIGSILPLESECTAAMDEAKIFSLFTRFMREHMSSNEVDSASERPSTSEVVAQIDESAENSGTTSTGRQGRSRSCIYRGKLGRRVGDKACSWAT